MSPTPAWQRKAHRAFERAVDAIEGGQSGLARLVGKTQGAVSKRLNSGKLLWVEDVLAVEAATGVPRWQLRPDIYPPEEFQSPGGVEPDDASAVGDLPPATAGAPVSGSDKRS